MLQTGGRRADRGPRRVQSAVGGAAAAGRRRAAVANASAAAGTVAQSAADGVEARPGAGNGVPAVDKQGVEAWRTAGRARQQLVGADELDDVVVRVAVVRLQAVAVDLYSAAAVHNVNDSCTCSSPGAQVSEY